MAARLSTNLSIVEDVIAFIRSLFPEGDFIPLHEPRFIGKEKEYVNAAIDSTFVSSVGEFVNTFEKKICQYTGAKHAIATVNGTAALHMALIVAGVEPGDEVITQPLSFVATTNAIAYCSATPVFLDIDHDTLGLSPTALKNFLENETTLEGGVCRNRNSGNKISACVPMHTFGHPCRIERIVELCKQHNLALVEDAAESLGSTSNGKHTGTFGDFGIYSFNGNKTITCGGGGIIVTNNQEYATTCKHLTTTAKIPHPYLYEHDQVGYNFRLPNLNAALACAQMENLDLFLEDKRRLADSYRDFFASCDGINFVKEPDLCRSNYWLNAIILSDKKTRDRFIVSSNKAGVMTRPAWKLLPLLPMYANCQTDGIKNALDLGERIINIPSSARL